MDRDKRTKTHKEGCKEEVQPVKRLQAFKGLSRVQIVE
jgi:hypothetical protein